MPLHFRRGAWGRHRQAALIYTLDFRRFRPRRREHHHGGASAQPSLAAPNTEQAAPVPPGITPQAPEIAPVVTPGTEHAGHEMGDMQMKGQFGPYPMSREASGTAWQPDSTPHQGVTFMSGDWMAMGHTNLFGVYDHQGGPRGANKTFAAGMVMGMAQRPVGETGTLGFRAMLSPDPLMGANGYPLLFATGETANGRTPLVDRQHPHDLFMELSGSYSHRLLGHRLSLRLLRPPGRTGAGAAGLHAPLLGHGHPRGAAHPSLARQHAHHLRRADRRAMCSTRSRPKSPGFAAASQISTATTLKHPALDSISTRLTPGTRSRPLGPGQLGLPAQPRAAGAERQREPDHRLVHLQQAVP